MRPAGESDLCLVDPDQLASSDDQHDPERLQDMGPQIDTEEVPMMAPGRTATA